MSGDNTMALSPLALGLRAPTRSRAAVRQVWEEGDGGGLAWRGADGGNGKRVSGSLMTSDWVLKFPFPVFSQHRPVWISLSLSLSPFISISTSLLCLFLSLSPALIFGVLYYLLLSHSCSLTQKSVHFSTVLGQQTWDTSFFYIPIYLFTYL